MTSPPAVLPYAASPKASPGLLPGTLLSIFAAAVVVSELWRCVMPADGWVPTWHLNGGWREIGQLILLGIMAVGAVLTLCRLNWSGWLMSAAFLLWAMWSAWSALWFTFDVEWHASGLPGGSAGVGIHMVMLVETGLRLALVASMIWLLWQLAWAAGRRVVPEERPWRAIAPSARWCIVALGLAALSSMAWWTLQNWLESRPLVRPDDVVRWLTSLSLVVAGLAARRRRGAMWCVFVLAVEWLRPVLDVLGDIASTGTIAPLRNLTRSYFIGSMIGSTPLPLLLILLMLHPQVRRALIGMVPEPASNADQGR